MNGNLVSIIIPCYNAEPYVGEAIESALGQTYANIEVIVIDDGSTDGSMDVIRSFGDRVRWETGPNRGACAARNRGLAVARGELVQFLDADDILFSKKLSRQVPIAVSDASRIVHCDWETCGEGKEAPERRCAPDSAGRDPLAFVLSCPLQTSSPLHWKRQLESVGGFREGLPCSQERDLHVRLASAGAKFLRLPEVLFRVRRRSGSVSGDSVKVLDQHADTAWNAYSLLQERGHLTDERARQLAGFLARDAREYLRMGEYSRASEYFRQARKMHFAGGLDKSYNWPARLLRRFVGARITERMSAFRRRNAVAFTRGKSAHAQSLKVRD